MVAVSPYRGSALYQQTPRLSVAVQHRDPAAMLQAGDGAVVVCDGYVSNWAEIEGRCGLRFPADWAMARRLHHLLLAHGDAALVWLNGEFSLLAEFPDGQSLVATSRAGTRPLFYAESGGRGVLATEPLQVLVGAGIGAVIEPAAWIQHLVHDGQFVERERTLYRGVKRLVSADVYRRGDGNLLCRGRPYWQPPAMHQVSAGDEVELPYRLGDILRRVARRTMPDEPFAVHLSGGLDSTTLFAMYAEQGAGPGHMHSCSMRFPGLPNDEIGAIRSLLRHCDRDPATALYVDATMTPPSTMMVAMAGKLDLLPVMPTEFQVDLINRPIREQGVRTVVSGHGGDLVFDFGRDYRAEEWRRGRWLAMLSEIFTDPLADERSYCRRALSGAWQALIAPVDSPLRRLRGAVTLPEWLPPDWRAEAWRPIARFADFQRDFGFGQADARFVFSAMQAGYGADVVEQLHATRGIECRVPLLDNELLDFAFAIPARCLRPGGGNKILLRRAMGARLPAAVAAVAAPVYHDVYLDTDLDVWGLVGRPSEWMLVRAGLVDPGMIDAMILRCKNLPKVCSWLWGLLRAEVLASRLGNRIS